MRRSTSPIKIPANDRLRFISIAINIVLSFKIGSRRIFFKNSNNVSCPFCWTAASPSIYESRRGIARRSCECFGKFKKVQGATAVGEKQCSSDRRVHRDCEKRITGRKVRSSPSIHRFSRTSLGPGDFQSHRSLRNRRKHQHCGLIIRTISLAFRIPTTNIA